MKKLESCFESKQFTVRKYYFNGGGFEDADPVTWFDLSTEVCFFKTGDNSIFRSDL